MTWPSAMLTEAPNRQAASLPSDVKDGQYKTAWFWPDEWHGWMRFWGEVMSPVMTPRAPTVALSCLTLTRSLGPIHFLASHYPPKAFTGTDAALNNALSTLTLADLTEPVSFHPAFNAPDVNLVLVPSE